MTRALITSDIHINNYPDWNLFNNKNFRLEQFTRLASRLVNLADEYECEYIFIAGDILHKAIITPEVGHTLYEFFDILGKRFSKDKLLFITGQHDTNSKSDDVNEVDSLIHVIAQNATYMDRKIISIDGKTVAFKSWQPNQDFSFIEDKVDVLIGHLTISSLFGQEYDNSKYTIGYFGDIHHKTSEGNSHTINVPIPHYLSDEQEGSVIVLDFEDLSWNRVPTWSDDFKYLRIYYEDSKKIKCPDPDYLITVPRPTKAESVDVVHKSIDVNEVIEHVVEEAGLLEVHSEISPLVNRVGCEPLDINFLVTEIEVSNFRSIKEFKFNPEPGMTFVFGKNGEGKSSLFEAINYVFCPPKSARHLVNYDADEMYVQISLNYKGNEHTIKRGTKKKSGFLDYFINGEEVEANSMSIKQANIDENLPFTKYFNLFYHSQDSRNFLSENDYSKRIELISKILGLDLVERFHKEAHMETSKFNNEINEIERNILKQQGVVEGLTKDWSLLDQADNILREYDEVSIAVIEINGFVKAQSKLNSIRRELEAKDSALKSYNLPKADSFNLEELNKDILDLKRAKLDQNEFISNINSLKAKLNSIREDIKKKASELNNIKTHCPTCKREFDEDSLEQARHGIECSIKEKEDELNSFNEEEINTDLSKAQLEIEEFNKDLAELESFKSNIEKNRKIIQDYEKLKENIKLLEEEYESLIGIHKDLDIDYDYSKDKEEADELLSKLRIKKASLNSLAESKESHDIAVSELAKLETELESVKEKSEVWKTYTKLFHSSGSVIKSIFLEVSKILSDSNIEVNTIRTLASGEERFDFDINYQVGRFNVPYDNLSGGQKTIVDFYFLVKLFQMSGRIGFMMLDETLKALSTDNLEKVIMMIKSAPITSTLISTHVDSFNFYDQKLSIEFVDNESIFKLER